MKVVWRSWGFWYPSLRLFCHTQLPPSPKPLTLACVPTSGPAGPRLTGSMSGFTAGTNVTLTVGEATQFIGWRAGAAETATFSMTIGPPLVISENVLAAENSDPATPAATATFTLFGP